LLVHIALGVSLILLGAAGFSTGLVETRRVLRQENWLETQGQVESGAVVWTGETYTARVVYKYAVDGVQFTGNIVKPGALQYNWRGPAERVLRRYPPGSSVVVFVDPKNIGDAVLEPGGSNLPPIYVAISAIIFSVGVVLLV